MSTLDVGVINQQLVNLAVIQLLAIAAYVGWLELKYYLSTRGKQDER